jgi:hypothetical protein
MSSEISISHLKISSLFHFSRVLIYSPPMCGPNRRTSTIQAVVNLEVKEQITFERSRVLAPQRGPARCPCSLKDTRSVLNDNHLVRFTGQVSRVETHSLSQCVPGIHKPTGRVIRVVRLSIRHPWVPVQGRGEVLRSKWNISCLVQSKIPWSAPIRLVSNGL